MSDRSFGARISRRLKTSLIRKELYDRADESVPNIDFRRRGITMRQLVMAPQCVILNI